MKKLRPENCIKVREIKGLEYPSRQMAPSIASALVVRDGNANRKPQCVHCKAEHYSASCEAVRIQVKQGEEITSIDVLPSKNQALCKYCTLASKLKHC